METKVRKIVQEFLEPIGEKSHSHQNEIKDLKLRSDFLMKKFEEVDRSVKIDLNLKATLNDMKKRIHAIVKLNLNLLRIWSKTATLHI